MSQTTKTVSIVTGVVLPAITAIVTIVLFFLFKPEEPKWHLFIFNMLYAVFLEMILFGWLGFLFLGNKAETSQVFKIITSVTALYYVIAGFIIMLVYNFGLRHIPLLPRYYYLMVLIITLIWVIFGSILLRIDVQDTEKAQIKADQTNEVATLISKMKVLASRFRTLQALHGAKGENSVDQLFSEFEGLIPKNVESLSSWKKLNTIIDELDQLLDEAESAPEEGYVEAAGRIKLYAKKTIGKVEQIKLNH
jgi:hypothetical protein